MVSERDMRVRLVRFVPGMKQSATRERLRRRLAKLLPDYDFTKYPVEILRPWQREFDRPAWSIAAVPPRGRSTFNTVSVYSQDTMSDVLLFGPRIVTQDNESIMIMADWPERKK